MQDTLTFSEQLLNWGKKLQEQHPESYICQEGQEDYFHTLLKYGDKDLLNSKNVHIIDCLLEDNGDGDMAWNWAFRIDSDYPDYRDKIRYFLDDDGILISTQGMAEAGYYMVRIEL